MKMVRSLLFGSAAGFVAVAGAQAADLPVKAAPVEYVRICTLYGAGFYYLPGTDICVKHGAYVRSQWYYGAGASPTNGPFIGAAGTNASSQNSALQFSPNNLVSRARSIYTLDARTQTEYGTLRGYVLIGFTQDWPGVSLGAVGATLYATRGFIQFAGFTVGKATSFYDIWSSAAVSYLTVNSSDTGDAGQILAAYTFQFGNGFSATIAAEDPRRHAVVNTSITVPAGITLFNVGANPALTQLENTNIRWPDIVGNLRVDQAWGSIQVMGAVHDTGAAYFVNGVGVTCNITAIGGTLTGQLACGRADDDVGFAVGAGFILRVPMWTGLTDIFSAQVNYTEGALRYAAVTRPGAGSPGFFSGTDFGSCASVPPVIAGVGPGVGLNTPTCLGSLGLGLWTDAIYANPGALFGYDGSIQKTTVWGVNASWDHLWTPALKTSVYGSYIKTEYNDTARLLFNIATCGTNGTAANTVTRIGLVNCDPDFTYWQVGSRTQWNITPSFYVGFDVMYERLETAFAGTGFYTAAANLPRPTGNYEIADQDAVVGTVRIHWDILP
jgi:Porin subfamily